MDQPETTLAGTPAALAKITNALLKVENLPVEWSNKNQSMGSAVGGACGEASFDFGEATEYSVFRNSDIALAFR